MLNQSPVIFLLVGNLYPSCTQTTRACAFHATTALSITRGDLGPFAAVCNRLTHFQNPSISGCGCVTQFNSVTYFSHIVLLLLTCLVGGDANRHTQWCPCAAGPRNPVECVDNKGVVRVGPELAHHHPGGLQAGLTRREEHSWAAGQAKLRARDGVGTGPGVISSPALENPSA